MTTVLAFDPGESIMDDATIKIPVDHFFHIRPEKAVLPSKTIFINLLKLNCYGADLGMPPCQGPALVIRSLSLFYDTLHRRPTSYRYPRYENRTHSIR